MAILTRYPSSNTPGTTGWTNPGNAYSDNGVYATAAPAKNGTISSYFSGFDFAELTGAVINTVTITFEYHVSTTASIATLRTQAFDGATQIGETLSHTSEPTTDLIRTLVIPATIEQLQSPNFKILMSAIRGSSTTGVIFSLDFVRVDVDYTPGSNERNGSLAVTLAETTLSASAKVPVNGSLQVALSDASLIASGAGALQPVSGALSKVLEDAGIISSGKVTVKGVLSAVLDSLGFVSSGKVTVRGSLAKTLDNAMISAAGKTAIKASLSCTLDPCTVQATVRAIITAQANQALENAVLQATGGGTFPEIIGQLAAVLESAVLGAFGKVGIRGGLSVTLADAIAEATGMAAGEMSQNTETAKRHSAIGLFGINGGLGQLRIQ